MKDVNKVILVGRLGADPVQRETKTGNVVVNFSLATSRRLRDDGEGEQAVREETQWHRVVAWGREGEHCARFLKKGHSVYVEGHMKIRQYDDKEGVRKNAYEVVAERVSFLGAPRMAEAAPADAASA